MMSMNSPRSLSISPIADPFPCSAAGLPDQPWQTLTGAVHCAARRMHDLRRPTGALVRPFGYLPPGGIVTNNGRETVETGDTESNDAYRAQLALCSPARCCRPRAVCSGALTAGGVTVRLTEVEAYAGPRRPGVARPPRPHPAQRGHVRPGGACVRLLHLRHALVHERRHRRRGARPRRCCCAPARWSTATRPARARRTAEYAATWTCRPAVRHASRAALGLDRHRLRPLPARGRSGAAAAAGTPGAGAGDLGRAEGGRDGGARRGMALLDRRRSDGQRLPPPHSTPPELTPAGAGCGPVAHTRRALLLVGVPRDQHRAVGVLHQRLADRAEQHPHEPAVTA